MQLVKTQLNQGLQQLLILQVLPIIQVDLRLPHSIQVEALQLLIQQPLQRREAQRRRSQHREVLLQLLRLVDQPQNQEVLLQYIPQQLLITQVGLQLQRLIPLNRQRLHLILVLQPQQHFKQVL